jgi:class 3 adenylate cyclase/tetratricopeptide (TPR) repeat protein
VGRDMDAAERLRPFIAGFVVDWLRDTQAERHRVAHGTLVFVDISGFTRLTERLASKGKIGAEEMSDILDVTFAALLAVAYDHGAWLVKWGGDAVLLLFEGEQHADRACTAAHEMRQAMRQIGRLQTSVGEITLRVSIGVHTGDFDFYLVGSLHRELVISGEAASQTVAMETAADAGQIVISATTAAALRSRYVGAPKGDGFLLIRSPGTPPRLELRTRDLAGVDLESCLPEITRSHLLAGTTDGEHRQIAVGFVEFSGIDALFERGGTAAVADAVDHVVRACQEAAQRHEVTFWETDVGVDGGKVMLVSGAPRSAGHDEDRMLAVAREVIDAGGELSVRAGVNSGRVYAGEFGPPFRRTYSVKGDAVNLAARLMSKAGPGEIFAAEAVISRARSAFATEVLAPIAVKGKARPVVAHRVGHAQDADAGALRVDLQFAGREAELAALQAGLAEARQGNGQVWEVSGEAGIGKSRLIAELVARAEAVTVVSVVCDQYHSNTPYAPFRRLLRRLAGIAEDTDPVLAGAGLLEVVSRAAPSLLAWTPLLAAVLAAQVESTPETDALEAKFRKSRQEEEAARFLAALVPGPLLLVVEDAHLIDDASLDLLRHLAELASGRPWLIVATTVSGVSERDSKAVFDAVAASHRMPLGALGTDAVEALIKLATEDRPLPPHEIALLNQRAGGNPLFVQELLGATRDGGTVSALPDSVEGLMAVQVDRLKPHERRMLRIASVLGVRVDRQVLDEMLRIEDVEVAHNVLDDFLQPDGEGLRFRHTLARDAAYEGLPFSRRQLLHGLAGQVIEQFADGRPDDVADVLSLHFLQARNFDAAWRYARVAGDKARDIHAQVEAAEFYERALDAAKRLETRTGRQVAFVAEALADARYKLGEFGHAARAYRSARALSDEDLDRARLCYKSSLVADRTGQFGSALRWLTRARRFLATVPGHDALRLRAECSAQYGLIRHWQGHDVDAVASLREAVELAEAAGADDALATALVCLDTCEMALGRSGAGEHAHEALGIWKRLGNRPWEEARVLNQLGIRAYFEGRWDEAVDYYRESKLACDRAGDQFTGAVEMGNMAEVLSDQGRLIEAEPLLRDALRVWRAAQAPSFVAFGKSQLGRLAARSGRFDEALELLRSARDDYVRDGEHAEILETDARIAECLVLQGAFADARAAADDALVRASSHSAVLSQIPLLQRVRGLALANLGDVEAAVGALEASLSGAHERRARHEEAWTLHALVTLRRTIDLDSVDDTVEQRQAALFQQLGIVDVAEPSVTV